MNIHAPGLVGLTLFILLATSGIAGPPGNVNYGLIPNYAINLIVITNIADGVPYLTGVQDKGFAVSGMASIDKLCQDFRVTRIEPFYKGKIRKERLAREVSRIYVFHLAEDFDPIMVLDAFSNDPNIESAEVYNPHYLLYDPNDPNLDQQWHLEKILSREAWDTVRGDTTRHSVIGIVDTGVNWNHPDLYDNVWINELEDINDNGIFDDDDLNEIDDDGNGFVDDVVGWDFNDGDNDPSEDHSSHGTGVAGCASEVTDNEIYGAGVAFSAQIMCIKATPWLSRIDIAYQGLIYAADNGVNIVNCSWATDSSALYQRNIINAVWEEDVLIVAGAGNHGDDHLTYPAAYEHVMAVAGTDQNDFRADFSSYGTWVDICAPAVDIWQPCYEEDFQPGSGTSYASPITAGLAALLRTNFPELSNDEIEQIIEDSADPIDYLNPGYEGLLGAGRINAAAGILTAIDYQDQRPSKFALPQNYPNPFNASTTISYSLPEQSDVRIEIYNILGERIITLFDGNKQAGNHRADWNASPFPSGVYFARLQAGESSKTVKMMLLK